MGMLAPCWTTQSQYMRPNRTRLNHSHAVASGQLPNWARQNTGRKDGTKLAQLLAEPKVISRQSAQSARPWRRAAIGQRDEAARVQHVRCVSAVGSGEAQVADARGNSALSRA